MFLQFGGGNTYAVVENKKPKKITLEKVILNNTKNLNNAYYAPGVYLSTYLALTNILGNRCRHLYGPKRKTEKQNNLCFEESHTKHNRIYWKNSVRTVKIHVP